MFEFLHGWSSWQSVPEHDAHTENQSPEYDGVQVERILDDAGGGRSDAQDVLLSRQVVFAGYPIQVREIAENTGEQLAREASWDFTWRL